jgi:hypothetical protein
MCVTLKLVRNDSATAGEAALGNGWLTRLGILVDDRVSCILTSIGLAKGFQRLTLQYSVNKRSAQSTDLSCTCTCPIDRMSAAGSEDLRVFDVWRDGFLTSRSLARHFSGCVG